MTAFTRLAVVATFVAAFFVAATFAACDDTPRGEQGIDFNDEAGTPEEAGDADVPDVHGPCQEIADPAGYCAQLGGAGTLYTHLISCEAGAQPLLLDCDGPDAAADASLSPQKFCCTTGLP